jgi:hypothetical protein
MARVFAVRVASAVVFTLVLCSSGVATQGMPSADPEVVFNTQTLVFHRAGCKLAQQCGKDCLVLKLSEARKRGGRLCKDGGRPPASTLFARAAQSKTIVRLPA